MAGSLIVDTLNGKAVSGSPVALESQVFGIGQTWQDVTASRALSTTYTNTTGRAKYLKMWGAGSTSAIATLVVNGTTIDATAVNTSSLAFLHVEGLIPNGSTYSITSSSSITKWFELI